jgi:hypothetical protein
MCRVAAIMLGCKNGDNILSRDYITQMQVGGCYLQVIASHLSELQGLLQGLASGNYILFMIHYI